MTERVQTALPLGRFRWDWLGDEDPGPLPSVYCRQCGRLMERVGPTPTRRFDHETGQALYRWQLRCPRLGIPWFVRLFQDHETMEISRYVDVDGTVETIAG